MKTLIAKFPGGYEEWAREKGEEPVHRVMPPTIIGLELKEIPVIDETVDSSVCNVEELDHTRPINGSAREGLISSWKSWLSIFWWLE